MLREAMPAGHRQTAEPQEAVARAAADSGGSRSECPRGCSWRSSTIGLVPAVERLCGRMRHLAMLAPGVEPVVDDKPRKMRERCVGDGNRRAIGGRARQQLARGLHRGLLGQRHLMALYELAPPGIDLLMDVDLHRTDIRAAA